MPGKQKSSFLIFRLALIIVVLPYAVVSVYVYFKQDSLMYYPTREWATTPDRQGMPFESITVKSSDNVVLSAWYVPAKKDSARVVLFAHGNAGNISHRIDSIRVFHDLGLNVLIFDYRGYGKSGGTPSEKGLYRDIDAFWQYLRKQKGFRASNIILFGRSLGGAVAIDLASRKQPMALIVESSFSSAKDMADHLFSLLPNRLLLRFRFNSIDKISRVGSPVLVLHSPADEIIPYQQGRKLYARAPKPKQFFRLNGGHNEGFLLNPGPYRQRLKSFIEMARASR